jgi:hypothetical protein
MGHTGGCLCGAVRYEINAAPVMQAICHCKNCQRQAGSVLSVIIALPRDGISITGETTTYEDSGESGLKVWRKFCPICGSPLFTDAESAPQLWFVKAGSLDNTDWVAPQIQFWTDTRQKWMPECAEIPGVARNPG